MGAHRWRQSQRDNQNCFQQRDVAARIFWRHAVVFFWSAECAVEDPGSQLNRHHVLNSTGQVVLRRSTEKCPAEIRDSVQCR